MICFLTSHFVYLCMDKIKTMSNQKNLTQRSAVIVANGRYPTHPIPLSIIEEATYIICTDGAANHFIALDKIPHAIVGDGDSISDENKIKYANILHIERDQECNDLTKSVRFAIAQGITDLTIVGGTGLRDDHTLGNISLLAEYLPLVNVKMVTNSGLFTPINRLSTFKSHKGEQVSIFAIDLEPITTEGLKYTIDSRILNNWWEGTLNESIGETFTVDTSGRALVFQVFVKK